MLGMGDIVGLVERAADTVDKEEAEKTARRALKGQFTLEDLGDQLKQIRGMGDIGGLLGMLPGVGKTKQQMQAANVDDKTIAHQQAIISSMTPKERRNPKILNARRRKRIAAGSGTSVPEVNRLLKQHQQMSTMMKKMGKMGKKGQMPGAMPGMPGMANMPGPFPPGRG
jgi:signal recognition particle subunit SRP54